MKIKATLSFLVFLAVACALSGAGLATADQQRPMRSYLKRVSETAVRVDLGKFALLRLEGCGVALRIINHKDFVGEGRNYESADYECYVFRGSDFRHYVRYTGTLHQSLTNLSERQSYVDCDTFRIEWSLADESSDWVYFGNSIYAIAQTDKVKISDVDFSDGSLQWREAGWRVGRKGEPGEIRR